MADGSIVEFEPLPPLGAIVLGEQIRTDNAAAFSIDNPRFDNEFWRYFNDNSIHSFMEQGSA